MRFTIFEALEIGLFEVPFHYSGNPFLFITFWICLLIGILVQRVLLMHCKRALARWSFVLFSLIGFFICEIGCQIITGWDLIAWLFFWFIFLTFLFGAGLSILIHLLCNKLR